MYAIRSYYAVAVSLIDTSVLSLVLAGTRIITSGTDIIDANYIEGSEAEILANVYIAALQKGKTLTTASGFTYGDKTAVGAAVAVNIADSDVRVSMLGDIIAAGKAVT